MEIKKFLTKSCLLLLVLSLFLQIGFAEPAGIDLSPKINQMLDYFEQSQQQQDWELLLALKSLEDDFDVTELDLDLSIESFEGQKATFYASRIMVLVAMDENPYEYEAKNLVEELIKLADDASFGSVYDQAYSLLALRTVGVPVTKAMLEALVDMQLEDGGFGFSQSDPDSTSLALLALANYQDQPKIAECINKSLSYLEDKQLESAAFASYGQENSNSTAKVLEALVALGEDPLSSRWLKNDNSIFDALAQFELADGSYAYTLEESLESNFFSYKQVLLAYSAYYNNQTIYDELRSSLLVSLRVEGLGETILVSKDFTKVKAKAYLTTKDLLSSVLTENDINYKIEESSFGNYLKSLNSIEASSIADDAGWLYLINGESGQGIDNDIISYNDEIVLYYGAMAPKTLVPEITVNINEENIMFSLSSTYLEYDQDFNASEKTVAIEDAVLTINEQEYLTDENGEVKIPALEPGRYDYSIKKMNEDGLPALLSHYDSLLIKEDFLFADDDKISPWAKNALYKAYNLSLIETDSLEIKPAQAISRAEAVNILLNSKGLKLESLQKQIFNDVSVDHKYYQAVNNGYKLGIISGVSDDKFMPDSKISRQEFAAMINNAFKLSSDVKLSLADSEEIASWAKLSVKNVVNNNIIVGYNNKFNPKENVNREMASAIALRLYKLEN